MNKETVELIKQYVSQTLSSSEGINDAAYNTLVSLLQIDKNMAQELHEVVGSAVTGMNNRYTSNVTSFEL